MTATEPDSLHPFGRSLGLSPKPPSESPWAALQGEVQQHGWRRRPGSGPGPRARHCEGDALEHHPDGSVTLTPDEAGQLRALLDSVMAGNRIQATLNRKSQDE